MSDLIVTLLFDTLLAVLLIVTISYCSRLSRRLRLMQDSRGEMAEMIARFDHATERASSSLTELQTVSKRITDALQLKIDKANFLADDLAFLIEKSAKLVLQLEQSKAPSNAAASLPKPKPAFEAKPLFGASGATGEAPWLKKPATSTAPMAAREAPTPTAQQTSSLEAMLQRLAASAEAEGSRPARTQATPAPRPSQQPQTELRTNAERELYEALKAGGR